MKNKFCITLVVAQAIAATMAFPLGAHAQPKPLQLVVPFAPGGGQDLLARAFNQELGAALGQPVIVEYRAGAGGMVGSSFVAKSDPASPALLVGSAGHTISALLQARPPYHPVNDFTAVSHIATSNQIVLVNAQVPASSVREFVAYARANPGKLNYASAGSGSSTHLSIAYLLSLADLKVEHIPYKSNADQIGALLAGTVQIAGIPNAAALALAKESRVRMLAVTAPRRSRFVPDLPTVAESGLPDYGYDAWFGLLGPARMPRAFAERVATEMTRLIESPAMVERLSKMGLEPQALGPQAFEKVLREDYDKLARIVKLAGAKAE